MSHNKIDYLDFYKINFGAGKYCTKSWGLASYEAGASSRQAEIDELQKRIDKLKSKAEWHIEDCVCSHPMSKYQLGWFEAMSLVLEILKGEN